MFIFSQDKKTILKTTNIQVSRNYGGKKDEKFAIVGTSLDRAISASVLGKYATKEEAIAELEHIFAAIKNGENIYAIR